MHIRPTKFARKVTHTHTHRRIWLNLGKITKGVVGALGTRSRNTILIADVSRECPVVGVTARLPIHVSQPVPKVSVKVC